MALQTAKISTLKLQKELKSLNIVPAHYSEDCAIGVHRYCLAIIIIRLFVRQTYIFMHNS